LEVKAVFLHHVIDILSENNAMGESLFCFPSVGIIALAYLFPNESLTDIKKKYC
jgi:hypothetical protein